MNYYVFADGLVGLKTNEKHFRWSFGSDAPPASEQDFQRCRCKLPVPGTVQQGFPVADKAETYIRAAQNELAHQLMNG